jgi:hypothetical protein
MAKDGHLMATLVTLAPIVAGITQAAANGVAATGADPLARVCLLVPGSQIAWDDCQCGQLAAAITRTYPSTAFPAEDTSGWDQGCGPQILAADITISVTRCVPIPDGNGKAPSCAALLVAAQVADTDAAAVRRAVACHLADLEEAGTILAYRIGSQPNIGPEGMCAGSELYLTIGIPYCACPPN